MVLLSAANLLSNMRRTIRGVGRRKQNHAPRLQGTDATPAKLRHPGERRGPG